MMKKPAAKAIATSQAQGHPTEMSVKELLVRYLCLQEYQNIAWITDLLRLLRGMGTLSSMQWHVDRPNARGSVDSSYVFLRLRLAQRLSDRSNGRPRAESLLQDDRHEEAEPSS